VTHLRRPARTRRAFTLLEILIVLGLILILASLVLGVGSALLKNAERSQVQAAFATMESAFNEWEAQTGRPLTYNGAFNSLTAPSVEVFPSGSSVEVFDVREPMTTPPAPNNAGNRLIFTRARGAGVYAVNLLPQVEAVRPILAGIPPSLLRPESNASNFPAANVSTGTPAVLYTPSAKSSVSSRDSSRSELVDPWGNRIAFVFPGRAYRFGVDTGIPDPDGTVRTPLENLGPGFGVCTNRRICLVSAGPDGLFGVVGDAPGTLSAAQAAAFLQTAAADNVYLYELDPPN
jgi:prepilin-type N-terminal cleavage/methylation domain-containing protein